MCGKTDDGFRSEESPGRFGRQIVLPEMNAVGLQRQRDVNAIVDDDLDPALTSDTQSGRRFLIKVERRKSFLPQLDQGRAGIGESRDLFGM